MSQTHSTKVQQVLRREGANGLQKLSRFIRSSQKEQAKRYSDSRHWPRNIAIQQTPSVDTWNTIVCSRG